jgi:hypothetical protein
LIHQDLLRLSFRISLGCLCLTIEDEDVYEVLESRVCRRVGQLRHYDVGQVTQQRVKDERECLL